jgi:hypothetical protein
MKPIGFRIDDIRANATMAASCTEVIDELWQKLEIARHGISAVVGEAVMAGLPLNRMERMLDVGWKAAVESAVDD